VLLCWGTMSIRGWTSIWVLRIYRLEGVHSISSAVLFYNVINKKGVCMCKKDTKYIFISTSQTSVPQIYVLFSNHKSPFKSQIGVQFSNLWPFLIFANHRPMMSLAYALSLTLTNKSAIDLRIWKIRNGHRFENWTPIWDLNGDLWFEKRT
jgi:hypothetical protein